MMKNLKMDVTYGVNKDWNKLDEWQQKAHPYTVTLKYDRKQMTVPFFMGSALSHEPTLEDVMPCLLSDLSLSDYDFEGFCHEFGYDEDSRKAYKTFQAVQKNGKKLEKLLGDDLNKVIEQYQDL
jgi:hypothetical protein